MPRSSFARIHKDTVRIYGHGFPHSHRNVPSYSFDLHGHHVGSLNSSWTQQSEGCKIQHQKNGYNSQNSIQISYTPEPSRCIPAHVTLSLDCLPSILCLVTRTRGSPDRPPRVLFDAGEKNLTGKIHSHEFNGHIVDLRGASDKVMPKKRQSGSRTYGEQNPPK